MYKILVVDDEENIQSLLKEFFEMENFLVCTASNGREALKKIEAVEMTYEDALKDYESLINNDHILRAFSRLFCDYMGIILGIMPVFLAVTRIY